MDSLTATKRLFHAIVVMGMAASVGACSGDIAPGNDAATGNDTGSTKDSAVADSSKPPVDAGGDAFQAWIGC